MNDKKKLAIIIDAPNWAFHNVANLMKKELENIAVVDIFAIQPEPYYDDLFLLLEDVKSYDYIHFLWRKNLLDFKSDRFKQHLQKNNIDYDKYINFFDEKFNQGDCLIPFWYFNEISTFVYVFYVHLLVDLNTENSYVSRRDISDLFWNIYSSKEIVNLFFKISLKKWEKYLQTAFLPSQLPNINKIMCFMMEKIILFLKLYFFLNQMKKIKKQSWMTISKNLLIS